MNWEPGSEAQKQALNCRADILLFGGSAGSLKTETMLMDAVQEYENPNLRAIIFRSSFTEMTDIVDKTRRLYGPLGGVFVGSPKWTWTFPSGATIRFAYMKVDDDVWKFLGPRYSFIGFDESTLHTEQQVRNILGRLSSTDPTLRLRMRLTSNPGNVGAAWHQSLFLHDKCPVHAMPGEGAQAGQLYNNRKWLDNEPIPFSVAFIPGKLSDHKLLDPRYPDRLRMMSGGYAEAMLKGCWCKLEGSYFPFLNEGFIKPLAEAGVEWWHNHFLSIDYGYGKSSSSVGLYVRGPAETPDEPIRIPGIRVASEPTGPSFPQGRIRKIGEIVVPHVPAYELAAMVVESFIKPAEGGERRRIVAAYLDPSNFKEIGDGHTIADQINEVLEPWDVVCECASNDRIGGWQLLYRMLRTGEFEIMDVCPETFKAIRSRMHDEKKPGDIKKVAGDPLDDVCLVGETLVATPGGAIPIKDVKVGDLVWTRKGLRSVMGSGMTNSNAATITVYFSDNSQLTGTPNHPVFTQENGFVRLDEMRYGDKIVTCQSALDAWISSPTKESSLGAIQNPPLGAIAPITLPDLPTESVESKTFTARFTRIHLAQFLWDMSFTTWMKIRSIMIPETTNSSRVQSTRACTLRFECPTRKSWERPESKWPLFDRLRSHGIAAKKVAHGIVLMLQRLTPIVPWIHSSATSAVVYSAPLPWVEIDFAPTHASLHGDGLPDSMMSPARVLFAMLGSAPINTPGIGHADVHVVGFSTAEDAAVYNLSVDGEHEYFANGILSHNCDETRYAIYTFIQKADKPREMRLQEAVRGLDITSAAIRYQQAEERLDAEDAPIRFSSRRMGMGRRR